MEPHRVFGNTARRHRDGSDASDRDASGEGDGGPHRRHPADEAGPKGERRRSGPAQTEGAPAWHALPVEEVLARLSTDVEAGLGDDEAARRLAQDGPNELRAKPPRTLGQMVVSQIRDPMVLILIGAAALSAALGELVEATVIAIIVVVNALICIAQERKAQSSLEALRGMSAPLARVMRQGEESVVEARDLVAGDVVLLRDGDMVPADLRLVDSANLKIQESSLTGESVPVEKEAEAHVQADCPLADRVTMAYSSSIVTYGRAVGVVTATGMHTEVGGIALMLDDQDELDTPLKRKLNAVGKALTVAGVVVCLIIIGVGLLYQRPIVPQLLVAISLAISIIPEGLPATATIVMALGVQRMARQNALVRKLPAVETLGGATVICTDKTGTLTLNKMTVKRVAQSGDYTTAEVLPPEGLAKRHPATQRELLYCAALCNDASFDPDRPSEIIGDPTEGALVCMARDLGVDHEQLEDLHPRLWEQPFDSARKRMSTLHEVDGKLVLYTKGAVEELLPLCTGLLTDGGIRPMGPTDRAAIADACQAWSQDALRVLGFALRTVDAVPEDDAVDLEHDLVFVGMVGMIDPPRTEVAAAVAACRDAGIRTVMVTGDHGATAVAIARELGIFRGGDELVLGDELASLSDGELDGHVRRASVFARVSPSDKLRIIESLKRVGETAAMTGDGVNDAPALKVADIGVAMGVAGTDVAKDAADMVLLDDKFTTIVYAIKEGRRVYRNIQKVIQFLLAGNIAEIATLLVATLCNWEAPLLAVHILWVNLATATLPALALGVDPASPDVMRRPPVTSGTLFERDLVRRVVTQGLFVAAMTLAAFWIGLSSGGIVAGHTMAFCVLAFSQMLRAFNQRSNTAPIWERAEGRNPWLVAAFAVSAALVACILCIPALRDLFGVGPLSGWQWAAVMGLASLSIVQMEASKLLRRRPRAETSAPGPGPRA